MCACVRVCVRACVRACVCVCVSLKIYKLSLRISSLLNKWRGFLRPDRCTLWLSDAFWEALMWKCSALWFYEEGRVWVCFPLLSLFTSIVLPSLWQILSTEEPLSDLALQPRCCWETLNVSSHSSDIRGVRLHNLSLMLRISLSASVQMLIQI